MKKSLLVLLLMMSYFLQGCGCTRVEGNERMLKQYVSSGLSSEIFTSGTYFYFLFFTKTYTYNVGTEKFIMGKGDFYNGKGSETVDYPAYTITTGGNGKEQPATFSVTLQYRIDPSKLLELHKSAQDKYEDLVIKPALTRIISDTATQLVVLDFYSGEGRVKLQKAIEVKITEHPALASVGIIVETFVIDSIDLDDAYVKEIMGRQLATQTKLRAIEEAKASEELAKKAEADAQATKLKLLVEAETAKGQKIRAAEATAAEVELAAKADAIKIKTAAEASRFQKEQDAKGLLAQGIAEAEVAQKKSLAKYSGEAGARMAQVEIEQARVQLFSNMKINGVMPEKTMMTIINGSAPMVTVPATTTPPPAAEK